MEFDSIGGRIRVARRGAKLSQAELAQRAFITQPAIAHYESDFREPCRTTLIVLALVLKTDFGEPWLKQFLQEFPSSEARQ